MLQRVMRALLLVTVLSTLGSLVGVSSAAASAAVPAAGSGTPPVPSSTVSATSNPRVVEYCVQNYAPNSTVTVTNNTNGATGSIHTDGTGSGCTTMPVETNCSHNVSNTFVATGTDQAGRQASSRATYVAPPDSSQCAGSPSPTPSRTTRSGHGGVGGGGGGNQQCDPSQAKLTVTVMPQGGSTHGTACGFTPGEAVDAFAHSDPVYLGTVTAAADGTVAGTFDIPMSVQAGQHTFEYIGRTSGNVASASFSVIAVAAGSGGGTLGAGGSGGGGLAFTGADIAAMVLAALVLLAIGALILVSVRRRRTAPAA